MVRLQYEVASFLQRLVICYIVTLCYIGAFVSVTAVKLLGCDEQYEVASFLQRLVNCESR